MRRKKYKEYNGKKSHKLRNILIIIIALLVVGYFYDGEDTDTPDDPAIETTEVAEQTETTMTETTVPTTEEAIVTYDSQAEELISSSQTYFDKLEFRELSNDAKTILREGKDELSDENRQELKDLSSCAIALAHIQDADYKYSEDDSSADDYKVLEKSRFCPEEVYDAITEYKDYNNQRWKRTDVVTDDYGTDKTSYTVTSFTSFQLEDNDEGFTASNIKPVLDLRVMYDDDYDSLKGRKTVSVSKALDRTAKIELDDGSKCVVDIDDQDEISLKINNKNRSLSNIVTAADSVVHKKDLTTKVSDSGGSYTVYITNTGDKYHSSGCQYLRSSKIPIDVEDAKARGYQPCSRCHP